MIAYSTAGSIIFYTVDYAKPGL